MYSDDLHYNYEDILERWHERFPDKEMPTREEIEEMDERLFEINTRYHEEMSEFEHGDTDKTAEQIQREKDLEFQFWWEDFLDADTWSERHEIWQRGDSV